MAMKVTLLFLVSGFCSLLLQMSFLHLLPLGPIVPDLSLILCVYLGLYRPTIGAVFGSFFLGYSLDVFSSPLLGLNAFALSLVFLVVYSVSRRIWIHNQFWSAGMVFFASWVKAAALILAGALFLPAENFWPGVARYILLEAVAAAVLAPLVFFLLQRGQTYFESLRGQV
jgi:rod shape-determining protein MreD